MRRPHGTALYLLLTAGLFLPAVAQTASVRRVQVLGSKDAVEIEIDASEHLLPQTQILTDPDRLVVDFPNATPGAQVRSQSVERGEVKSIRVGLFQSNPPVTRVVLDLKSPQSFEVFPYGRTVMIKVTGAVAQDAGDGVDYFAPLTRPGLVNANFPETRVSPQSSALQTAPASKPSLEVSFHNSLLSIHAKKASLSEVLFAVHQRTGAEIAVPAGAEQESVVADIDPGPAPEVLARLLNGSRFNFLILSSAADARGLDRVILSPRGEGGFTAAVNAAPPVAIPSADDADDDSTQPVGAQAIPPQPPVAAAEAPSVRELPAGEPEVRPSEDPD